MVVGPSGGRIIQLGKPEGRYCILSSSALVLDCLCVAGAKVHIASSDDARTDHGTRCRHVVPRYMRGVGANGGAVKWQGRLAMHHKYDHSC